MVPTDAAIIAVNKPGERSARRRAFTLIELLVVIAIIALLVSILLPTLRKAKDLAYSAVCASNLHTLGRAMHLYGADFNGAVPYDETGTPIGLPGWHARIGSYPKGTWWTGGSPDINDPTYTFGYVDFNPGQKTGGVFDYSCTTPAVDGTNNVDGEPLFMDRAYVAQATPYEKPIVPGALTFSVAEGLTILSGILHGTGMAFLGVRLTVDGPVFIGDTITASVEVSAWRPEKRILTLKTDAYNQAEKQVVTGKAVLLVE